MKNIHIILILILTIIIIFIIYNISKDKFLEEKTYNRNNKQQMLKKQMLSNMYSENIDKYFDYIAYLGKGHNLASENYNDIKTLGSGIFRVPKTKDEIDQNLDYFDFGVQYKSDIKRSEYTSYDQFINKLNSEIDPSASANIKGICAKIDGSIKTGTELESEKKVTSIQIEQTNIYGSVTLNQTFYKEIISDNFIQDVEFLSKNVYEINPLTLNEDEWQNYYLFVSKYGTHVINSIVFGSKFDMWYSSTSSDIQNTKTLDIAMCLDVGKEDVFDTNVCTDISEEEKNKVRENNITKIIDVKGGSNMLRADFLTLDPSELTKEKIKEFIDSGETNPGKISFKFLPIWKLINSLQVGSGSECKIKSNNVKLYSTDPCKYSVVSQNLENFFQYKLLSRDLVIPKDNFYNLVNKFNDKCLTRNYDNSNVSFAKLENCDSPMTNEGESQLFKANDNSNIQDNRGDCMHSLNKGTYGTSFLFGKNCGSDETAFVYGNDQRLKLSTDNSLCLDYIHDIDASGKIGENHGELTINNCNDSDTQKWSFKTPATYVDPDVQKQPVFQSMLKK